MIESISAGSSATTCLVAVAAAGTAATMREIGEATTPRIDAGGAGCAQRPRHPSRDWSSRLDCPTTRRIGSRPRGIPVRRAGARGGQGRTGTRRDVPRQNTTTRRGLRRGKGSDDDGGRVLREQIGRDVWRCERRRLVPSPAPSRAACRALALKGRLRLAAPIERPAAGHRILERPALPRRLRRSPAFRPRLRLWPPVLAPGGLPTVAAAGSELADHDVADWFDASTGLPAAGAEAALKGGGAQGGWRCRRWCW